MAPPVTASPGEVKSTATLPTPTLPPSSPSLLKRADHALTTPYVFPPECTLTYNLTSAGTDIAGFGFGIITETFLAHNPDSHWSSCQPTGAVPGYKEKFGLGLKKASLVFQGAVCPSGWKAFEVGLASTTFSEGFKVLSSSTWSTANCCKRFVLRL